MNVRLNFNTTSTIYFGNQSQRGQLAKSIIQTELVLLEKQLPNKFINKVTRGKNELNKIQETRWQSGNKRYQGKDRKIDADRYN